MSQTIETDNILFPFEVRLTIGVDIPFSAINEEGANWAEVLTDAWLEKARSVGLNVYELDSSYSGADHGELVGVISHSCLLNDSHWELLVDSQNNVYAQRLTIPSDALDDVRGFVEDGLSLHQAINAAIERGLLLGTIIEYSDLGVKLSDYHEVITLIDGVVGAWNG